MISTAAGIAQVAVARRLRQGALKRLRDRKVRRIVRHAAHAVAFYRERFRREGIDPHDIRTVDDLRHLPVVTRAELQEAGSEMRLADGVDRGACAVARTSGSTGEPLESVLSRRDMAVRQAVELRTLLGVGFRPCDRLVSLGRTRPLERRLHHRLGLYRSWAIPPTMPPDEQARILRRLRPTVLWAYPTSLRTLMNHLDDDLQSVVRPRILITAAERLDDRLRKRLVAACPVEVFDFYGAVEIGRIAAECRAHRGLHVNADFLVVESMQEPHLPPDLGQVVITTLEAFAMPLIRYQIGDLCSPLRTGCPCGCPFPLVDRLAGREGDLIRLPSGRLLPSHSLDVILRDVDDLQQYLVIQEAEDHLVILLAPGPRLRPETLATVREGILHLLGEPVRVELEPTDEITTTELKARTFVSKLGDLHG